MRRRGEVTQGTGAEDEAGQDGGRQHDDRADQDDIEGAHARAPVVVAGYG
jgi:hypothetical protein